jgi:cyclase
VRIVAESPLAQTIEIADGVFAYIQPDGAWWRNNTGFVVGSKGVVSVDSCSTERRTRAYLDAISAVSPVAVRTLINTHHHGDHTFGNSLFAGATIVAREGTRDAMRAWGPPGAAPYWTPVEWGDVDLEMPFLTFSDRLDVWVDDMRCEMLSVGSAAHTTNDSVFWLPDHKILYAGDLIFNGGTPFMLQGSIAGAIDVLEHVVKPLKAEVIVAGHGPLAGPASIDDTLEYLLFVQSQARMGMESGLSPLDAARRIDLGPFAKLLDAERIVGNLHRAYAELAGAARGAAIDTEFALTEMVDYHGGPLDAYGV